MRPASTIAVSARRHPYSRTNMHSEPHCIQPCRSMACDYLATSIYSHCLLIRPHQNEVPLSSPRLIASTARVRLKMSKGVSVMNCYSGGYLLDVDPFFPLCIERRPLCKIRSVPLVVFFVVLISLSPQKPSAVMLSESAITLNHVGRSSLAGWLGRRLGSAALDRCHLLARCLSHRVESSVHTVATSETAAVDLARPACT